MKSLLTLFSISLFLACPKLMLVEINNELTDAFFYETECGDVVFHSVYNFKKEQKIRFSLEAHFWNKNKSNMDIDSLIFFSSNSGERLKIPIKRAYRDTVKYSKYVFDFEVPQELQEDLTMKLDKVVYCNSEFVSLPDVKFLLDSF